MNRIAAKLMVRIGLCAGVLLARAYGQTPCISFPSGFIPFTSVTYVTAADSAGDHLVVGIPASGAISLIKANIPTPTFTNEMFCDTQVQLAPGQFYSSVYVPTAAEVGGNFSAFNGLLTNPATNQPFPNGTIPSSQLNALFAWRIGPAQASSTQAWSATGSMAYKRTVFGAAVLPSGKVFVAGGCNTCNAEIYDPTTGAFSVVATPLAFQSLSSTTTATLLQDGRVLIVSGVASAAAIYDPVLGQFSTLPPMVQSHGTQFVSTLLQDGRVLIVGGNTQVTTGNVTISTNSGAELFDPVADTFTAAGPMSQNRIGPATALLPDGRVLVAGGIVDINPDLPGIGYAGTTTFSSVEIFDPKHNTFTLGEPMHVPRVVGYAALLPSGKVLVGGGDFANPPASAELFDPATGTFTLTGAPVAGALGDSTATLLSNGQVLVSGGHFASGAFVSAESQLYIPSSGSFISTGNMTVPRELHTNVLLPDGQVLAMGGTTGFAIASSAELYTPVSQGLITSQTGLTFGVAQGNTTVPSQSVAVLSNSATIPWTVSTHTYEGGNWLSVTPASGNSVPGAAPTTLTITANPAGLAAQVYYGAVILTPTDGIHPPISIVIVLNIVPAGTPAPPAVTPSGLLFFGTPGTTLQPQSFSISNLTSTPIAFSAVGSNTPKFFNLSPSSGTINGGQSASITVTPNTTGLTAGAYSGSINITFGDGTTQAVQLLLVLSKTPGTASDRRELRTDTTPATCTPSKLLPVFTTIGTGFNAPVAWPTPIVVEVVDNCGNAFNAGSVIVSFTDGDPPINLLSTGNGNWGGTWVPQHNVAGFAVRADAQQAPLSGSVQVTGQTLSNPSVPVVTAGGVVSSVDFASAPAVGLLVSIFGSGLADSPASAGLPLPASLGSTSVVLSGSSAPLPLLYAGSNIINVMVPYDAVINSTQQLVVQRASAISVPVPITVFSASPSIASTSGTGSGQGHVYVIGPSGIETLANQNAPATAGNPLVIYCVGLGAITPVVPAGAVAPTSPLSNTNAPVTVTFGTQSVTAAFAGLTPGLAGLYQVNVTVPPGVTPGNQVPVTISVGGKSSSSSIYMAIQ